MSFKNCMQKLKIYSIQYIHKEIHAHSPNTVEVCWVWLAILTEGCTRVLSPSKRATEIYITFDDWDLSPVPSDCDCTMTLVCRTKEHKQRWRLEANRYNVFSLDFSCLLEMVLGKWSSFLLCFEFLHRHLAPSFTQWAPLTSSLFLHSDFKKENFKCNLLVRLKEQNCFIISF